MCEKKIIKISEMAYKVIINLLEEEVRLIKNIEKENKTVMLYLDNIEVTLKELKEQ